MRVRSLLVLALVATACTTTSSSTTVVPTTTLATTQTTVATTTSTSTTEVEQTTTLPPGTEALPLELRQDIGSLIALTEELRDLEFFESPTITVVTDDELEARVRELIAEETEDLPADEALYELLGLVSPDVDLLALYLDLYGEQVAGFYDGETGELVVPASESALTPLQKATLVHELTHALTDQRFDVWSRYEALIDGQEFDSSTAFLAVIEGDATLTEILYLQQLSRDEQQEALAESLGADSTIFESAPRFLQNSLLFPYQEGFGFVQRLYGIGGFDEINRAYVSPPVSSEQILTPRDFGRDEPVDVTLESVTLEGYELVYDSVWGELGFDLMFEQGLGETAARTAADGWKGDRYHQWFDGTDAAIVIDYRGESDADALEMEDALVRYTSTAMAVDEPAADGIGTVFVGDDYVFVGRTGDRVVFVAAGDPAIGAELRAAFPQF